METTASKEIETLIESVGIHLSLRSLSVVCLFGFFFLYNMPVDTSKRPDVSMLQNGNVNNSKCTEFIN